MIQILLVAMLPWGSDVKGNASPASSIEKTEPSAAKKTGLTVAEQHADLVADLARQIWEFSEPAFQEFQSSKLLADTLEQSGFRVDRGVAGMKTAFVAEYGSGRPIVAILAEYDALPGLSQAAVPYKDPVPRREAGHGCGHNLFGAASTVAAIAARRAIEKHQLKGTIRLYGCPAEEGGGGKTYLVRDGFFREVDVALHWHPSTQNDAQPHGCLAVIRFRVQFHGRAAHAAGSPHDGRSAMDGVELMNVGVNYLREHVIPEARIHYVVTHGGKRPNIVPDFAEAWYYIRAPKMSQAKGIFERVKKIAEGAALMSETKQELRSVTGTYEILPNKTLASRMLANFKGVGPPTFAPKEIEFAKELRSNLGINDLEDLADGARGPLLDRILEGTPKINNGSTDVGDVSWNVPTAGLQVATAARGIPGHSWSFVACSGTSMGERGAQTAARVLAATAIELLENPRVIADAKAEFDAKRAGNTYQSFIDKGPPPERLEGDVAGP